MHIAYQEINLDNSELKEGKDNSTIMGAHLEKK